MKISRLIEKATEINENQWKSVTISRPYHGGGRQPTTCNHIYPKLLQHSSTKIKRTSSTTVLLFCCLGEARGGRGEEGEKNCLVAPCCQLVRCCLVGWCRPVVGGTKVCGLGCFNEFRSSSLSSVEPALVVWWCLVMGESTKLRYGGGCTTRSPQHPSKKTV